MRRRQVEISSARSAICSKETGASCIEGVFARPPALNALGKAVPLTDHVGINTVTDGTAGDGCAGVQALDNLGFERLELRWRI